MLSDPLSLINDWSTITADAGETRSFPAIERAADHSSYRYVSATNGSVWTLTNAHQFGRRSRYTSRLTVEGVTPDLLVDNQSMRYSQSCYVVFDCSPSGPVDFGDTALADEVRMMKIIGGLLVSVDTADPIFRRIIKGET